MVLLWKQQNVTAGPVRRFVLCFSAGSRYSAHLVHQTFQKLEFYVCLI
jgi:hypothetical protein